MGMMSASPNAHGGSGGGGGGGGMDAQTARLHECKPLWELEVAELLDEVIVDYTKVTALESYLHSLKDVLDKMPEEEVEPGKEVAYVNGLVGKLGSSVEKLAFRFTAPESVELVGSFMVHTIAKPVQNVDVCVQIPKGCFHEKDFLNYRYHAKRVMYLATIERHLKQQGLVQKIEWGFFRNDACKPFLILRPDVAPEFSVRLLPTISSSVFDVKKLAPTRNNLRDAKDKEGNPLPTPHYSNGILEDMFMRDHLRVMHSQLSSIPALRKALVMLKVWLRQRGMQESSDTFNGFLLTMFAVHLCTAVGNRKIVSQMSSKQIFRVIIKSLAETDLLSKPIFMVVDGATPGDECMQLWISMTEAFDVVFCDPSGRLNLAGRITKGAVRELKQEAFLTQTLLLDERDDVFDIMFMTPVEFSSKFDYVVRLQMSSDKKEPLSGGGGGGVSTSAVLSGADIPLSRREESRIAELLAKALGERAALVRVKARVTDSHKWSLEQGVPDCCGQQIIAGILLSEGDAALKMVDVGPSADDKEEAKKFRQFWGPKTELRRFRDGTIAETAVWECPATERHLIIKCLVEHVLFRHVRVVPESVEVVAGQLDCVLLENGQDPASVTPKLLEVFGELSKNLRALPDLPLTIVNVQPLSAAFRNAAVFPPKPHPLAYEGRSGVGRIVDEGLPRVLEPLEVLLQLEGSGKWPDDPEAVRKTKTALCLKIAEGLQQKHGVDFVAAEDAIDVLMGGFAFRLTASYERESTSSTSLSASNDFAAAAAQAKSKQHQRGSGISNRNQSDMLLRRVHAGMLQGLQGQFPAYGQSVRLAKRWVSSHMFSDVLCEEAVELLMGHIFSRPYPFPVPRSRVCGLMRFLNLLWRHDWAKSALIVDINKELNADDWRRIQASFEARRGQGSGKQGGGKGGGPAMYISQPYDRESATWTRLNPSVEALKRLTAYAKSSAGLLSKLINGEERDPKRWKSLYRTPVSNFDVLIFLKKDALPHADHVMFPATEAVHVPSPSKRTKGERPFRIIPRSLIQQAGLEEARRQLLIGFDPTVMLLSELQAQFGSLATFWRDAIGGDVIGVTWIPKSFLPSKPKQALTHLSKSFFLLAKDTMKRKALADGEVLPDATAILEEMTLIGGGLVEVVRTAPPDSRLLRVAMS